MAAEQQQRDDGSPINEVRITRYDSLGQPRRSESNLPTQTGFKTPNQRSFYVAVIDKTTGTPRWSAGAFDVPSTYTTCSYCDADHLTYSCPAYPTIAERRQRSADRNLCLCCEKSHAGFCRSPVPLCRSCDWADHGRGMCPCLYPTGYIDNVFLIPVSSDV